MQYKADKSYI